MSDNVHINVIVDNTTSHAGFVAEHGLSLWIEYQGKKILFDTGQSNAVISNAKKLGIDLAKTDAIVLSHGHYDHTGGLPYVLEVATKAKIYLHPSAVEPKFSKKKSSVKHIGMPESAKKILEKRNVIWTEKPTDLFFDVEVTGQVPRINDFEDVGGHFFLDENYQNPDCLIDEQSLFIESTRGMIVVLGCAHAGVVNILDYISQLTGYKQIYAVIGGMHLLNADKTRIENTIDAFNKFDVQKLVLLHCTGQDVMENFKSVFGDRCIVSGAGDKIIL